MHQHDQRLPPFIFHDQGFDHAMLVHAQAARAVGGATMFLVRIEVAGKNAVVFPQQSGGGRYRKFFLAHERCFIAIVVYLLIRYLL